MNSLLIVKWQVHLVKDAALIDSAAILTFSLTLTSPENEDDSESVMGENKLSFVE